MAEAIRTVALIGYHATLLRSMADRVVHEARQREIVAEVTIVSVDPSDSDYETLVARVASNGFDAALVDHGTKFDAFLYAERVRRSNDRLPLFLVANLDIVVDTSPYGRARMLGARLYDTPSVPEFNRLVTDLVSTLASPNYRT